MLVTALVGIGRHLRCGDDNGLGNHSAAFSVRDVLVFGNSFLFNLPSATHHNRETRFSSNDDQSSHAVDSDHNRSRAHVLPTVLHSVN